MCHIRHTIKDEVQAGYIGRHGIFPVLTGIPFLLPLS